MNKCTHAMTFAIIMNLTRSSRRLVGDYSALESMKSESGINIPQDVVEYVEAGRNPNVYTRQFSEAVTKESQGMHGKMTAHEDFATVLGSLVEQEFPELRDQVAMAMQEEVQPQEIKE